MDRLVSELENLNFQQISKSGNADKNIKKYLESQILKKHLIKMSKQADEETETEKLSENEQLLSSASVSSEENSLDASEEESEDDEVDSEVIERNNNRGGINVRKMPRRMVKQDILHSKNLRTSMKPSKTSPKTTQKLRPAEIKKLYTNKKLTKFRPTSLETIFEEPQPMRGEGQQFRLVGAKKLRRALICSDGLNANKTVVNRRRAKIKKNLGRRIAWKKIPLQNFLNYMQNSLSSETESDVGNNNKCEKTDTLASPLKTVCEIQDFEMDLSVEDKNLPTKVHDEC